MKESFCLTMEAYGGSLAEQLREQGLMFPNYSDEQRCERLRAALNEMRDMHIMPKAAYTDAQLQLFLHIDDIVVPYDGGDE